MLAQRSAPLSRAVGVLMELSADEQTRLMYEAHEKARRDEMARMRGVRAEGRAEGHAEGRTNERYSIARNALALNMDTETIIKLTGISREEIERLSKGG